MKVSAIPAALAAVLLASAAHPATSAVAPGAAGPTEFTVDTTSDAVDADPSDGRCRTASGTCSLRAAVMAANARPGSTITLPPGRYRLTIPPDPRLIIGDHPDPTTGDLNVDAPTTIQGTGARSTVIDADRLDRVFRLRADTHMSDVTITGGRAVQRELPFTDTGGGGIANGRHLTLRRVAVTGNSAGYGGGIFNVPDSTWISWRARSAGTPRERPGHQIRRQRHHDELDDRRQPGDGPGDRPGSLGGYGGGIDIRGLGTVRILNSTIVRNSSTDGGAESTSRRPIWTACPRPSPTSSICRWADDPAQLRRRGQHRRRRRRRLREGLRHHHVVGSQHRQRRQLPADRRG
ncbi:CSLREA domain-containing protein [Streptomyces sp. MS1.AVA.1]|uniref:CSLREA domain-containing protein n=1 Tax=Streptomyces machairae TaxID=3134109 RepID=A0ABU8UVC6_9ACTN